MIKRFLIATGAVSVLILSIVFWRHFHTNTKYSAGIQDHLEQSGEFEAVETQSIQTHLLPGEYDMNHNGIPETFYLTYNPRSAEEYRLSLLEANWEIWSSCAGTSHIAWNSVFAVKHNGQDCLLQYIPYMSTGHAFYSYKLFSLDEQGNELPLQSGEVTFDVNFCDSDCSFDPKRISAFLQEVRALLNDSQLMISTENGSLLSGVSGTEFTADQFWTVDLIYNSEKSLEENLRIYADAQIKLHTDRHSH